MTYRLKANSLWREITDKHLGLTDKYVVVLQIISPGSQSPWDLNTLNNS